MHNWCVWILIATYDAGWNDPPPMSTEAVHVPISGKPRISLNKRVAFPMQSSGTTSNSNIKTTAEGLPLPFSTAKYQPPPMINSPQQNDSIQAGKPPPPPPVKPVSSTLVEQTQSQPSCEPFDLALAKQLCNSNFNRVIDSMGTNTTAAKLTEIRKRLDILDQAWEDNKLTESVQKILYQLAEGRIFGALS